MAADLHLILVDHEAMAINLSAAGGVGSGDGEGANVTAGGNTASVNITSVNTTSAAAAAHESSVVLATNASRLLPAPMSSLAAAAAVRLEAANIYLHLLRQLPVVPRDYREGIGEWASKRAPHERGSRDCPKLPGLDPAAPWLAPNCTVFPYTGLENDIRRLAEVQVWNEWGVSGRVCP